MRIDSSTVRNLTQNQKESFQLNYVPRQMVQRFPKSKGLSEGSENVWGIEQGGRLDIEIWEKYREWPDFSVFFCRSLRI